MLLQYKVNCCLIVGHTPVVCKVVFFGLATNALNVRNNNNNSMLKFILYMKEHSPILREENIMPYA